MRHIPVGVAFSDFRILYSGSDSAGHAVSQKASRRAARAISGTGRVRGREPMAAAQAARAHKLLAQLRRRGARTGRKLRSRTPALSVVIVNYCQWQESADLIRAILASEPARRGDVEVVIVDNHSPVCSLAKRLRRCRSVSLRRWKRNRGFARAVNEGCRLSQGNWILLLNPDVTIGPDFIEAALRRAERSFSGDSRAGVIGFRLCNSDGSHQLSSGDFPTLAATLSGLLLPRARRKYVSQPLDHRSEVAWVTGCCWMVRRECLEDVGGLDERFFLYYEDVDFCHRARKREWSTWYDPSIDIVHHQPLHRRTPSSAVRLFTRHALLTYASKHWPRWQFRMLARIVGLEARLRAIKARTRADSVGILHYRNLAAIARLLRDKQVKAAKRILSEVVEQQEEQRGH
jgi:N-acetylglucosaminyl-diphospho-decaprenol L-rhamnosyltransferase